MTGTSIVARDPDWHVALAQIKDQLLHDGVYGCDLALLFASHHYASDFAEIVAAVGELCAPRTLIGCSGQGVIGGAREVEDGPALAIAAMPLPGADIATAHLTQEDFLAMKDAASWERLTGVSADASDGWICFGDPFTIDAERLIASLSEAYAGAAIVGGMASGEGAARRTHLFLNGRVFDSGAVVASIGGTWALRAVVAQGAAPIGRPWTITGVDGQMIRTIGERPAYEVLADTFRGLTEELQQRAQRNLLVGIAMDEYRDEFGRGDFLIRNLIGADRESGSLAVSALPRVGQTLQFQVRDAGAADEDLRAMLDAATSSLGGAPAGALLCSCNGRGVGLFGAPHHDAGALAQRFEGMPVAGFFCNGEIGPVGGKPYLHGFTASIGFLVPKAPVRLIGAMNAGSQSGAGIAPLSTRASPLD
jgi:small ligand-binding sensory domain FIST